MPVTADDVAAVVDHTVAIMTHRLDADWKREAGPTGWSCWDTVDHVSGGLFFYAMKCVPVPERIAGGYPFSIDRTRPDGDDFALVTRAETGVAGLLRGFAACGGMLVAALRHAPPDLRADHWWGRSDAEGFGAMAIVEVAVHVNDIASALGFEWRLDEDVCDRILHRLFPDAPTDTPRWPTLLWATGRSELAGRARLDDWRWYGEPR